MDIQTALNLSEDEEAQLTEFFGNREEDLAGCIGELARAAVREYVDMVLGLNTLRSPENREHRLLLLILEAYEGRIPDEAEVSRTFNITRTSAGSLIRSVMGRYRIKLSHAVHDASKTVLENCGDEEDGYRSVSVSNPALVVHLNQILAERDGTLKKIERERKTGTNYRVPEDSYRQLKAVFGL